MFEKWFAVSTTQLLGVFLSALFVYVAVLLFTRIVGLRSFSKMSAADFAMTIACGSILGATVSAPTPTAFAGAFAILCLYGIQWCVATGRRRWDRFSSVVDNRPILLMAGSEILHENLRRANVSEEDLMGKLREANAIHFGQVKAVVFENTGDVSVLHSCNDESLEPRLFADVVDSARLFAHRNDA